MHVGLRPPARLAPSCRHVAAGVGVDAEAVTTFSSFPFILRLFSCCYFFCIVVRTPFRHFLSMVLASVLLAAALTHCSRTCGGFKQ